MINVSNEFKTLMNTRTDFKQNAIITLLDGTVLEMTEKDFTVSNNAIIDGAGSSGLPLGVAIRRNIQIELINDKDQLSIYDFFGAKIRLYLTFELSERTERIEEGIFTVITPETYGTTVVVTAVDDMYKADKKYDSDLKYPATAREVLVDACSKCDIPLLSTTFENEDFVVSARPDTEMTYANVIGYIALLSAGNARINRQGNLEILHYNQSAIGAMNDGGQYVPWFSKANLDGGDFTYNIGDVADGGDFVSANSFHTLSNWKSLRVDTDDVVITGITMTANNTIYQYGTIGYMLSVVNPLASGNEQAFVDYLGEQLVGMTFRKFEGDSVSNPLIEFMDPAIVIDRKGRLYSTFITDVDFNFFGLTVLKNSAENAVRNSSKYNSESVKAIIESKKLVEKEKTDREVAIADLAHKLATSSGLYMTIKEQEDGSSIYYMHDKPTLAESMVVWKLTALAFAVSTDGGKTYPYGFTVDGTTITRLLYAEGINADYITTGTIKSKDKTASIDLDNGIVSITSDHFSWESTNSSLSADGTLTAKNVDLSGKITADSGTIGKISITNGGLAGIGFELSATNGIICSRGNIGGFTITEHAITSANGISINSLSSEIQFTALAATLSPSHRISGYMFAYEPYLERITIDGKTFYAFTSSQSFQKAVDVAFYY